MSDRQKPINHGTIGGYRTHFRRGEPVCEPCREADRKARGNKPWTPAQCGTIGGHAHHIRLGEPTCAPCRAARAAQAKRLREMGMEPAARHALEAAR